MKIPIFLVAGIALGVGVVGVLRYEQQPSHKQALASPSPAAVLSPSVSTTNAPPSGHLISTVPASAAPSSPLAPALTAYMMGVGLTVRSMLQNNDLPTSTLSSYVLGLWKFYQKYGGLSKEEAAHQELATFEMLQQPPYNFLSLSVMGTVYDARHPQQGNNFLNETQGMPSEAQFVGELVTLTRLANDGHHLQTLQMDAQGVLFSTIFGEINGKVMTALKTASPAAVAALFGMKPLVIPSSPPVSNVPIPSSSAPSSISSPAPSSASSAPAASQSKTPPSSTAQSQPSASSAQSSVAPSQSSASAGYTIVSNISNPASVAVGASITVTFVVDKITTAGKTPIANVPVTFGPTGSLNIYGLQSETAVTNANGEASVNYTGTWDGDTGTITATADGVTGTTATISVS